MTRDLKEFNLLGSKSYKEQCLQLNESDCKGEKETNWDQRHRKQAKKKHFKAKDFNGS